ncbi:hypothetical protein [Priestia endophytica]|uniref:Uncharacterized protein n=1 Tax=Priestia endophytica DSM 13796 TaxID=1121089 RepID=A0A1I6C008_9BACI|nr:hypothetical protein [Priestia endophytica]KYG33473.1 hypothetical protein AZF06_21760 [Priestia endophytica]SFQ86477.1 hypothetical protein SAMN02745910_04649 [Priestia endophytica DSM 13796]
MSSTTEQSKPKYKSVPLDRDYPLFPKQVMNLEDIENSREFSDVALQFQQRRIDQQLELYKDKGVFKGEMLVMPSKTDSGVQYELIGGYSLYEAAKILGFKEMEVRVKRKIKTEQATDLVTKRLSKQKSALEKFKMLEEKLSTLREHIHKCDFDLYDLLDSVDEELQTEIREAHQESLHTPLVYKQNRKIRIDHYY